VTRRVLYTIPIMLLAAILLSACLEKPADGNDAGQNSNNNTPDAGQNNNNNNNAPDVCQADDLIEQKTCGSGRKCTLIDAQNHVGCAPTGFTPAYADCDPTRPDDCSLATLCSDADDPGRFICLPFCEEEGAICMNGKCTHQISLAGGTAYLCAPADGCDPVSNDGCDPLGDPYCYLDRAGGGLTFCVSTPGTATAGQPCTSDYGCVPGMTCFGPQGSGTCYALCHAGNDGDCGLNMTCSDIANTDYGLCIN
jgi:hypothetical protein